MPISLSTKTSPSEHIGGLNINGCCSLQTYFNQQLFAVPAPVAEPLPLEHTAANHV